MFISHSKICLNYINVYFLNADGKREVLFAYILLPALLLFRTLLLIAQRFAPYFCSFLRSL